jgi:hypothetical protein
MARDDRCPPIPLHVLWRVPAGSAKLFILAAAEGRSMNPRGDFDALTRGERPIGVRVSDVHRDRVLLAAGVGLRHWQAATRSWTKLGLAHRCARGRVFLIVERVAGDVCPDCKSPIQFVSTRTQKDLHEADTKRERPSDVQSGEPSTKGTSRGEVLTSERVQGLLARFESGPASTREPYENEALG